MKIYHTKTGCFFCEFCTITVKKSCELSGEENKQMKDYPIGNLRNIAILGHGGDGKTALTECLLHFTKTIDRLGKLADGNTVSDFDPEEIKRQISIATSLAPVEYDGYKINIIDTPGYFDFAGEVMEGLDAADAAIIVVSGKSGVEVGTEKAWKYCSDFNIPCMVYVSKIDEENADYYKVVDELREAFGISICPIAIPIHEGEKVVGLVNCASMTARKFANGTVSDCPMPTDMDEKIKPIRSMITESVAETDEELMEKYFGGEEFTDDEIKYALRKGVKDRSIVPITCGSSITGMGMQTVLYNIIKYLPSPDEGNTPIGTGLDGSQVEIAYDAAAPVSLKIFKTVADQFVGKMSYFKVISGTVKQDSTLINTRTSNTEKIGRLFFMRGKKQIETDSVCAGDIGVITKLATSNTGDTLCASSRQVIFPKIEFPKPCLSMAVLPKAKGDEEKISSGLSRLLEEDPTFDMKLDTETKQQIISGLGDMHIDVVVSKLKNKFGVSVELKEPKVPYRETLKKKVKVEGKHKKQSGGHGQFGHVWIEFEPGDTEDMIFEEKVFGGAVPRNFFPAVEKGLRDCMKKGVLAGYPVVNLKATLVDGSYHPVDSSEMAFKVAASLAYKTGLAQAGPTLLEPIGKLSTHIPEENMGDVIGDINKRRGQVLGMGRDADGLSVVEAEVPMAEMHTYLIDMRSITRGRGFFTFEFLRYQEAPPVAAQKVIEAAKAEMAAEE